MNSVREEACTCTAAKVGLDTKTRTVRAICLPHVVLDAVRCNKPVGLLEILVLPHVLRQRSWQGVEGNSLAEIQEPRVAHDLKHGLQRIHLLNNSTELDATVQSTSSKTLVGAEHAMGLAVKPLLHVEFPIGFRSFRGVVALPCPDSTALGSHTVVDAMVPHGPARNILFGEGRDWFVDEGT